MTLATAVLGFLGLAAVLVATGTLLARAADAISATTKLGRVWVGSVLLATATSLPELSTDVAAARLGAVDIGVGDLFGSGMCNMLVLALVDLMAAPRRPLLDASLENALIASVAIALNALAAMFVLTQPTQTLWDVSPASLLLLGAYALGIHAVYVRSQRHGAGAQAAEDRREGGPGWSKTKAIVVFAVATLVTLAAAPFFARTAITVAQLSGLGESFVGTFLVGASTSFPELVASAAAVRLGATQLAVGNLFGSNAFNMIVFLAMDAVEPGSVFANASPHNAIAGLLSVILMSLGVAAIVYRAERRLSLREPNSLMMVLVYLAGLWVVYSGTGR
jgi:cation:H+ antiporter